MQRVFGVRVHLYRARDGRQFVASARDPVIPASLRPAVTGTSHLESYTYPLPHDIPDGGLKPVDLLEAYDIKPLRDQGLDGSGQTVVFFEIDGYRQSDFDAYTKRFHLPPMHPVIKAGLQLAPGGEAPMDLEVVHAIAPGARLVVYNLDQNKLAGQAGSNTQFLDALVSFQQKIVNGSRGAIVSNSVGSCANALGKGAAAAFQQVYDRADALGETWFAASGDQGAYDCLQALEQPGAPPSDRDVGVDLPASAPGVTGVGGTRLSVRTDGSWYTEKAWEGPAETAGGGGGVSTFFPRPPWQRATGVGNTAYDPHGVREVPDVSAVADPATSGTYAIDGQYTQEGGTSQAAPIWAGIIALIDEYLLKHGGHALGFANPALYALARTHQPYSPFHDVTVGANLLYPATPGYDMASGLGTPDAWNLARDLLAYEGGRP
jgi:kumamolisin